MMAAWTAVAPDLCYKLGEADRLQAELQIRVQDPVKEISHRLFPNDHLEAQPWLMTSYRSLALPFTPILGSAAHQHGGL